MFNKNKNARTKNKFNQYIYLGNNPKSIADAHEIGPVTVFQGAHFYDLPTIDLYDYNYILYWCKPFGVKVGEGQIK